MFDMTDRIKAHLDELMYGAPNTRRVGEMKQELLAGCLDKYEDLVSGGMDPESSYQEVINGIGDVNELLGIIEKVEAFDPVDAEEKHRKRALFNSAGIGCYFIGLAMAIMFGSMGYGAVGFGIFILFCGVGTMLLLFGRAIYVTKYEKADDTLVEEMKVQMSQGNKGSKMVGLASSTLWSLVVVLYLGGSFLTMAWSVSWIVFPLAAAVQCAISAWFLPQSRNRSLIGAFWCLTVTVYLIVSFATFAWHITWIIFPLAVAIQQAVRMLAFWRSEE